MVFWVICDCFQFDDLSFHRRFISFVLVVSKSFLTLIIILYVLLS